jgi:serine/threonine protein kinase
MKKFKFEQSLAPGLTELPKVPLSDMLDLYLRIFLEIVDAVEYIHSVKINHYDIKCSNVLLAPKRGDILKMAATKQVFFFNTIFIFICFCSYYLHV